MKRKSLFFRFFGSYLGIGLVLIIFFGSVFFYFNVITLEAEERGKHYTATTQSLNKLDYTMESMANIAYHFSSMQSAEQDPFASGPLDERFYASQLESYEQNLPVPTTALLYRRGDTEVALSGGRESYQSLESRLGVHVDLTMSSLFGTLNSTNKAVAIRLLRTEQNETAQGPAVVWVYPIPYMSSIPSMSIAFLVEGEEINSIVEDYSGEAPRNIYLLDNTLQVVYRHEVIPLADEDILSLMRLKGTGVTESTIQNRSMAVVRALSDNTGYSLLVVMESNAFFSRVGLMRSITTVCIIVFFVLTLMLAFLLAMRNYKPIRTLLTVTDDADAPEDWDLDEGEAFNELELLQHRIDTTRNKNRELGMLIDMQRPYIVHTCISSLLQGNVQDREALAFQLQCANITLNKPFFQVLLLSPVGKDNLADKMQVIVTACGQMNLPDISLFACELILEKRVALIVNSLYEAVEGQPFGIYVAHRLQKALKPYGYETSVGIGSLYTEVDGIHTSLMEAFVVTNEYLPATSGSAMSFGDIPTEQNVNYAVSATEQSLLAQALKHGDEAVALQTLHRMVDRITQGTQSLLITQYQCFDIANTLIKAANQRDGDMRMIDPHALGDFKNPQAFQEEAEKIVRVLCRQYASIKEKRSNQLSAELIGYVNANYRDGTLSLEQMAAHFDLSPSYLSRFFKQVTGRTFIQYISVLRIEYVKTQLAQTDLQIKDIVVAAGYIDIPSFVRKFKAMEGITPGQYRQQARHPI